MKYKNMARFEGEMQEFHDFVGPRIRNKINTFVKKHRKAKNGICEECREHAILDSAHVHGKGRRKIIESVLEKHVGKTRL